MDGKNERDQLQLGLYMSHQCHAVIVTCIDFRFQEYIYQWAKQHLPGKQYDLVAYAGATKDLDIIMRQLEISVRLHSIEEAVLVHHEECGAYGDESNRERHAQDLGKARERIAQEFPFLHVLTYYLHLDGTFEEV